ncbi:3713_t:CDS:1 [Diversispora eburnea]|uniref:3713_t:CDS:1 n=1 Tax=Diversispora eburnea TaxID=1213867 RepID=A0A9N8WNG0_9GLOM|nr:3713_t:CDS:1 [Diversispora eburnea]
MSLSINKANIVKVPFPPSISVDEIVQIHLKHGIKNVNKTMNAFMIYRKEYNRVVAKFNLSSKDVSKFVSISWKNEPKNVKYHYQRMAKNVKKCFKKKVPPLFFVNSNQVDSTNNHVSLVPLIPLDTVNPSLNTNQKFLNDPPQNFLISTYSNIPPSNVEHLLLNIEQTSLDSIDFNLPPSNMDQNVDHPLLDIEQNSQLIDNFKNDFNEYLIMDENEFMNHLSEDMTLTYKAIIQSLPV